MYAVITDIHGNLEALQAVFDDLPEGLERVYCLGDVIGYGASPNECADEVRERQILTISGNHDLAIADEDWDITWFNPVAARAVLWGRETLTGENREFLLSRPRMMQSAEALFVHGSIRDPDEYILDQYIADANLALLESEYPGLPLCFFGHTHVKSVAPQPPAPDGENTMDLSDGPYLVNPGSVGQPRDGDTFASYVLVEGTNVRYRFVDYDIERSQAKIRAANLPDMLAERLAVGR